MVDAASKEKPRLLSTGAPSRPHARNLRDHSPRRSHCIPKHKSPHRLSKKCWSLSKRCESTNRSALYYFLNRRPTCAERKAAMKRCALCHGRLGLGARFRNIWNGHWWVHVRFLFGSLRSHYEVKRNNAVKHRWHAFLARGDLRS